MLKRINIANLLSFGDPGLDLELGPLNVLIGPNASGKSNLLLALQFLKALPTDVFGIMRKQGGPMSDLVWRGASEGAHCRLVVTHDAFDAIHEFEFSITAYDANVMRERVMVDDGSGALMTILDCEQGRLSVDVEAGRRRQTRSVNAKPPPILGTATLSQQQSALAQIAQIGTVLWDVAFNYKAISSHRPWSFGSQAPCRLPQPADMRNDVLESDASNLALVLARLMQSASTKKRLLSLFQLVYEGIEDIQPIAAGGSVQLFVHERGFDKAIPATRLSDGTLHYLTLLALLCDPEPPPLICIDEPELGLHPDILTEIAKLLIDASTRTQLVVTTHSEVIVDALSEAPESVIVTEKHGGATAMKRLDKVELSEWLKEYRLGQLWSKGQIGGNRW